MYILDEGGYKSFPGQDNDLCKGPGLGVRLAQTKGCKRANVAGMFRMRGSRVVQNEAGEVNRDQVMYSIVGNNREVCIYH